MMNSKYYLPLTSLIITIIGRLLYFKYGYSHTGFGWLELPDNIILRLILGLIIGIIWIIFELIIILIKLYGVVGLFITPILFIISLFPEKKTNRKGINNNSSNISNSFNSFENLSSSEKQNKLKKKLFLKVF